MLSFRPSTKHASIEGLYFVGASTHPGTGVPICLAGSKVTSEQVLEGFEMSTPWSAATAAEGKEGGKGEVREIDRVSVRPVVSNWHVALWVLGVLVLWVVYQRLGGGFGLDVRN